MPTALGTVASHRSVTATAPPTTGLRAWFDADDDANILYRSPGDQIMNWTDRTHVEVMSDYYGPGPHHSGTQNGHKTVVFNGESFGGSEWMPNTDNLTMVVAFKHTGAGSGAVEIIRLGAYWGYSLMARSDNQNLGILCSNTAWVHTDTPSVLNAPTVLVGQRTDGTWTLHRDGVSLPITDGATATPGAPGNNESWLSPSPNLFIGEIYELLIYDKALSTTERQQVERYLATKWILVGAAKTGTAAVTYTETATAAGVAPVTVTGPIPTAGLVGWWDESEILANAGAVTGWRDKSGNGFHLTGTGPTTGVKTQLGHATVTFNGNGNLQYVGDTGLNVGAVTVFVVCEDRTGNSIYRGVFGAHAATGNDYDSNNAFVVETGVQWMNFDRNGAAGWPPNGLTEDPPFTVWSCEYRPDGTIQPYMNGVAGTSVVRGGPTFGVANGGWLLGGRFEGGIPTTGSYFTGEVGEVVVYNRVLSTVERQQVDQYLMQKWVPPASYFSGGIVTDDGTWRTHKLVTSDTLTYTPGVTGPINAEYLVVAGGGGGSRGGGGAGGLLSASVTWVADQTVTVGAGGAAGNSGSHAGSGSGSSIGAVTVVGGGGGGATQDATGYNGGSGGGGGVDGGGTSVGGTGVAGTGYNGGGITSAAGHPYVSAGGGGATAVGQSLPGTSQQGGTGGAGKEWPAASGKFYGGGGGGGSWTTSPAWGVGGIGGGGNAGPTGSPGLINTGGGGGGGGANTEQYGGVGGSGVVLVRYPHVDGMPTGGNPLTMASWHAAYWASDPDWTPPADGATAATWRDGSGNGRTMTAVGAPLYRATSTLNSKPAVEISANNGLRSAPFTAVPTPWAVFVVFKATDTAGEAHVASAGTASTWGNSFGKSGGAWSMVANNYFSGGTVTAGAHAARVAWEYLTTTGSQIVVDGVVIATGGQPNNISDTATTWNIGSGKFDNQSFNWPSEVAFVGFKASPLTAHEAGNLEAWARSFYGTP